MVLKDFFNFIWIKKLNPLLSKKCLDVVHLSSTHFLRQIVKWVICFSLPPKRDESETLFPTGYTRRRCLRQSCYCETRGEDPEGRGKWMDKKESLRNTI